jgi:hypothetical protein
VKEQDPSYWATEPLRCALDAIVYRWVALFGLPVVAAVIHATGGGKGWLDPFIHAGQGAFLVGFIGVHLLGRLWRRHGSPGGWQQAVEVDRGTVTVARLIGWTVMIGTGLALIAPLGTLADPKQFGMEVLLWFPLLFPLYCLAVWVTIDCARDRLGRAVEESQRRFHQYWRDIAQQGKGSAA